MAKVDSSSSPAEDSPSMEDILRTIRGVIASGAPPADASTAEPKSTNAAPEEDDVLDLTMPVIEPAAPVSGDGILGDIDSLLSSNNESGSLDIDFSKTAPAEPEKKEIEPEAPIEKTEPTPEPEPLDFSVSEPLPDLAPPAAAPSPAASAPAPAPTSPIKEERSAMSFLSDSSASQTRAAFEELMHKTPPRHTDAPVLRSGTSLEELVIEALRPYLVDWMDRNLPTMVKQLVEKEIRRLVPRDTD